LALRQPRFPDNLKEDSHGFVSVKITDLQISLISLNISS